MQEGSKIRIITEYLKSKLEKKIILDWGFVGGKYINKRPVGFIKFENNLPYIVESVECKGKLIYITVYNEYGYCYIINTLKSDDVCFQEYKDSECSWYIKFKTEFTSSNETLWFKDPKCLSTIQFTSKEPVLQNILDKLGPDILCEDLNLNTWINIITNPQYKNNTVIAFLDDQRVISGLGNIDKSEALFYAKISPLRKIGSLCEKDFEKLYEAIRIITRISYNKIGLSEEDFLESGVNFGGLKIYKKSGANKIMSVDGDIIYWDSKKQI